MKERPILMSAPMVRAILEGRKTQTRRIIKPQPTQTFMPEVGIYSPTKIDRNGEVFPGPYAFGAFDENEGYPSKHGQQGDRLWVKETAIIAPKRFAPPDDSCIPDADGDKRYIQYTATSPDTEAAGWYKLKKTPSIFMPRWASRITLEITAVRVERLQKISAQDAIAEGIGMTMRNEPGAVQRYSELWESINGPGSWAANPWVWAITFKRIKP